MKQFLVLYLILPLSFFGQSVTLKHNLRMLALGDSYTIGQSVATNQRWPNQLSDSLVKLGCTTDTLRIIATTGWRTDDLLNAISGQQLQQQQYNLVSLLIGVNNQFQGKPFTHYVTEFNALLDSAIRYAGNDKSHVFVVSIPDYAFTPYGQSSSNPSQISSEIDQYNQYNKHVADSLGVTYINITPVSRDGLDSSGYVASDGLHPSGKQYTKWVQLMLKQMTPEILTGISNETKKEFQYSVYPNPAKEFIAIYLPEQVSPQFVSTLAIYNGQGSLVYSGSFEGPHHQLNTNKFPSGLYTLQLRSGNFSSAKKIIIE